MSDAYTSGPWTVRYSPPYGYAIEADGRHIATSILYAKDGGAANAALIAAAPELLDTLQSVRVFVQDCITTGWDRGSLGNLYAARDAIDRAIAKATGSAS